MILIIITDGSLSSLKTAAVQDSLKQSLQSICPDDNVNFKRKRASFEIFKKFMYYIYVRFTKYSWGTIKNASKSKSIPVGIY